MKALFSILFLLAVTFLAHPIGEAIPKRWFYADRFPYHCFRWEKKLYAMLRVAKWKDKLPDMSKKLPDMQAKRIATASLQEIDGLLRETCVAESVHWVEILLGGGCLAISPGIGGLIWAVWTLLGNLPFIVIQRYNRPRLMKLKKHLAARQGQRGTTDEHFDFKLQYGRRS